MSFLYNTSIRTPAKSVTISKTSFLSSIVFLYLSHFLINFCLRLKGSFVRHLRYCIGTRSFSINLFTLRLIGPKMSSRIPSRSSLYTPIHSSINFISSLLISSLPSIIGYKQQILFLNKTKTSPFYSQLRTLVYKPILLYQSLYFSRGSFSMYWLCTYLRIGKNIPLLHRNIKPHQRFDEHRFGARKVRVVSRSLLVGPVRPAG